MPIEQSLQCEEIQPWLAAFALGEADDDAASRAHLAACPSCQHDLSEYRSVASLLPYGAPESAPPEHLRARVLAAIGAEAKLPEPMRATSPAPAAQPPRRRLPSGRSAWAAYAFALLTCVLLFWNVNLQSQLSDQKADLASDRQSWQTMIALLNDSSLRWYAVAGQQARGHFWTTPQGQQACLVAQSLPALARGQVYQVWLDTGAEQTSVGTFEAHDGNGWVLIQAGEPISAYTRMFVTAEPASGSAKPTGPHVLDGSLTGTGTAGASERWELARLLPN